MFCLCMSLTRSLNTYGIFFLKRCLQNKQRSLASRQTAELNQAVAMLKKE